MCRKLHAPKALNVPIEFGKPLFAGNTPLRARQLCFKPIRSDVSAKLKFFISRRQYSRVSKPLPETTKRMSTSRTGYESRNLSRYRLKKPSKLRSTDDSNFQMQMVSHIRKIRDLNAKFVSFLLEKSSDKYFVFCRQKASPAYGAIRFQHEVNPFFFRQWPLPLAATSRGRSAMCPPGKIPPFILLPRLLLSFCRRRMVNLL
jgi:hypothetical protein